MRLNTHPAPSSPAAPRPPMEGSRTTQSGVAMPVRIGKRRAALSIPSSSSANISKATAVASVGWGCKKTIAVKQSVIIGGILDIHEGLPNGQQSIKRVPTSRQSSSTRNGVFPSFNSLAGSWSRGLPITTKFPAPSVPFSMRSRAVEPVMMLASSLWYRFRS